MTIRRMDMKKEKNTEILSQGCQMGLVHYSDDIYRNHYFCTVYYSDGFPEIKRGYCN